jgi:hypothetical protein
MSEDPGRWFRRWRAREKRMLGYLAVLVAVAAWSFLPRPWHPTLTLETAHHRIESSATRAETEDTARALELLYEAYANRFAGALQLREPPDKMKVKLFKDRAEFRRINPRLGWAEAFYREPYCRAYYAGNEINPYHWMLHESVHQLNHEAAHLSLEKWLEEGLADYFATSRLGVTNLALGRLDLNTYPVWWIDELATAPSLNENLRNGSVIPLRAIITNRGGPSMRAHFNLYYLHWWTLTHFLLESPRYREGVPRLLKEGGGLHCFESAVGPVERIQEEWHSYARRLKAAVAKNDPQFLRTGKLEALAPDPLKR